jgi:hypothetical protein
MRHLNLAGVRILEFVIALAVASSAATAAPALFPLQTVTVKLDGVALGQALHPASLDRLGGEWLLTIWSPKRTGTELYNYNANVWDIGSNINNLMSCSTDRCRACPSPRRVQAAIS